jgi:hypothetical protein
VAQSSNGMPQAEANIADNQKFLLRVFLSHVMVHLPDEIYQKDALAEFEFINSRLVW